MMRGVSAPITYQREPVHGLWPELLPMMEAHYVECYPYQDIGLQVDTALYEQCEDLDCFRAFTARAGETLIGYAAFFMRHHAHYKLSLQAYHDSLYIAPDWRFGLTGPALIAYTERSLRDEGVQVVSQACKAGTDVGKLLMRLGYEAMDVIYTKRLDRRES